MIIAATADIHSPRFYEDFVRALDRFSVKPDLFFLAGDMVHRGEVQELDRVRNALFGKVNCPIIAVFGNSEFIPDKREELRKRTDIKFLDDESLILRVGEISVGIVGTTGSLDLPTRWQRANIPNIERIYSDRIDFVSRHLQRMVREFKILAMHYSPTYKTLDGINPRFWGGMGSQLYENVLAQTKPHLVLYGHSHVGKRMMWIDSVPVYNVSLPLNKDIVVIDTENDLKPGITKFV
jgi:Icc-related predicted phosphoesterase